MNRRSCILSNLSVRGHLHKNEKKKEMGKKKEINKNDQEQYKGKAESCTQESIGVVLIEQVLSLSILE